MGCQPAAAVRGLPKAIFEALAPLMTQVSWPSWEIAAMDRVEVSTVLLKGLFHQRPP
jgi:hypothetical protein